MRYSYQGGNNKTNKSTTGFIIFVSSPPISYYSKL